MADKYTFKFESDDRVVELTLIKDDASHTDITRTYIDFLRGCAFIIPSIDEPDICDLALN